MGQIINSRFQPAWWLPGAHLQTIWPTLTRRHRPLRLTRQRIELADGDFIELMLGAAGGPRVLLVHGLEGDLDSHYALPLMATLTRHGFQPVFMYLRGCAPELNRLDRMYHSGASDDLAEVLAALQQDRDGAPVAAIGVSLGANLLLKYLGETPTPLLRAAIAISVPFVLRDSMLKVNLGFSRIYRHYLLEKLKAKVRRKYAQRPPPFPIDLGAIHTFNDFDERITAPLNGFNGAFDYYRRCSCRSYLPQITTPTLILQARDDPFVFPSSLPEAHELGPGVTLELSAHGGHVGFISGTLPWRPRHWLEQRILNFLQDVVS